MKVREMCLTALMAAFMCIVAPLTLPVGPVPVSLATLAVYMMGVLLGARRGAAAVGLYILIGAVGIPVFSGFRGGLQHLVGVTGGYLIGYVLCAWTVGFCVERWEKYQWIYPTSMLLGTAFCYAVGTMWFMFQTQLGAGEAFAVCVLPFLPGDAVKIILASVAGAAMRARLRQ